MSYTCYSQERAQEGYSYEAKRKKQIPPPQAAEGPQPEGRDDNLDFPIRVSKLEAGRAFGSDGGGAFERDGDAAKSAFHEEAAEQSYAGTAHFTWRQRAGRSVWGSRSVPCRARAGTVLGSRFWSPSRFLIATLELENPARHPGRHSGACPPQAGPSSA